MKLRDFIQDNYLPHIGRVLKPRTVAETKRLLDAHIVNSIGDKELDRVSFKDVYKIHTLLRDTPVQANRLHAALSGVYRFAFKTGLVTVNPCAGITLYRETPRERYLSPDEIKRLVAALPSNDAGCLLKLLLLTGARPGELLTAEWGWLQGNVLRLPDAKRGARNVYLPPAAMKLLEPRQPKQGRIFKYPPDIRRAFARAAGQAGIENARIYDLRHTFASAALASGVSLPVIGQLLGHKLAQTTLRYAHLSPEIGLEAATKAADRLTTA